MYIQGQTNGHTKDKDCDHPNTSLPQQMDFITKSLKNGCLAPCQKNYTFSKICIWHTRTEGKIQSYYTAANREENLPLFGLSSYPEGIGHSRDFRIQIHKAFYEITKIKILQEEDDQFCAGDILKGFTEGNLDLLQDKGLVLQ